MNTGKKNKIIIISSPSGAGKTTLCKMLIKKMKNLSLSISYTSRGQRLNEINGKDYYFVNKKKFIELKNNDFFIETAVNFGNLYGSPISNLKNKSKSILFDIDWKGARKIRKKINHSRYQKIITSSAKQCGRSFFPVLHEVSTFNEWIEMYKNEENVVCHMSSDRTTKQIIKSNIKNLNIIIGPEGDFSQKELTLMDSYNFKKLNLGNRRLRAESAAMCAMLKICQILE